MKLFRVYYYVIILAQFLKYVFGAYETFECNTEFSIPATII